MGLRDPDGERSRQVRLMPLAVPVILSLGMGALFLDLELKAHVLRFYATFRPASPMSWGAWILLAIYPATLLLGLAQATDAELAKARGRLDRLRAWARERLWALRLANVLLGIALGVYTGILLGTLGARAVWSSAVLGPLFLVSGLSTGAAFMMLFPLRHDEHGALRRWDMLAISAELALLVLFLIGLGTSGARGQEALSLFLGGPYTATLWSLVVVAGLLVPFALEHLESRRALRPTVAAPLLLLTGGLALRVILVASGQA
ncbi:MAG: hypothetical protein AMXMBFR64_41710 [Myxococcales bacterium]